MHNAEQHFLDKNLCVQMSCIYALLSKNAYLLRRDTHFVVKLQKLTIFPFILAKKAPMLYLKKQRCLAKTAL